MKETLKKALKRAIHTFYQKDQGLVEISGTERSCVFRIGIYLQAVMEQYDELKGLSLDCEYNKKGIAPKGLAGSRVRPDLIIHKRLSTVANKLVVEFKGWWDDSDDDFEKLKKFTNPRYGYPYELAVFVHLGKDESSTIYKYFENGMEQATM